jgi:hypothetical protein
MAVTDRPAWGADVPISMPVPVSESVMVPMFGFGMTQFRLVPDMTSAEYESLSVPVYAPVTPQGSVVAGDAGIDATGKFSG